jgi:GAF domain-containing protein
MMRSDQDQIGKLQKKNAQLSILYSIGAGIGLTSHPNKVLEFVLEKAVSVLKAEIAAILLLDEQAQVLSVSHARGLSRKAKEGIAIRPGEGLAGKAVQLGEVVVADNLQDTPELIDPFVQRYPVKSALCLPIKTKDRICGAIYLSRLFDVPFTRDEVWILTILAKRAGVALESAELYHNLEKAKGELEAKIQDLEWMNEMMVGRELRMIELKREVNELSAELGRPPVYDVDFERETA